MNIGFIIDVTTAGPALVRSVVSATNVIAKAAQQLGDSAQLCRAIADAVAAD